MEHRLRESNNKNRNGRPSGVESNNSNDDDSQLSDYSKVKRNLLAAYLVTNAKENSKITNCNFLAILKFKLYTKLL